MAPHAVGWDDRAVAGRADELIAEGRDALRAGDARPAAT